MADSIRLRDAILAGDPQGAVQATRDALASGVHATEIVNRYMIPALDEVGRRFEGEEYFVPELLLSGRAIKRTLDLLRPLLTAAGAEPAGRVVIGTVKGDLHDIGKNLVASMLEAAGFEVFDLGTDVAPERFAGVVRERNANIVCLSGLLTATMPAMKTTIDTIAAAGLRDKVKILVGGAPVKAHFATEIKADGYSENASGAVALARSLAGQRIQTQRSMRCLSAKTPYRKEEGD